MKKTSTIPKAVWILGLASLFTDASSEMIHAVLPLFLVESLGSSGFMVGLIDGIGETVASSVKVISGGISDWCGKRKPLVVAGYGLSAVVKPLFAIATNPSLVLLARCLDRVGKGIRGAPRDALIADLTDKEALGAAYGLRQSLDSVGAVIGPVMATLVLALSNNDFRQVFWIALIPAIVPVLLLIAGIREPKSTHFQEKKTNPFTIASMKSLGRGFWMLFAVTLIFTLGNSSDAFLVLKSKDAGIPTIWLPMTFVAINVIYSISAYPLGKLSDRIGRKKLLMLSFLFYAIVYAGIAFAATALQIWVLLCLYGVYLGLSHGVILAITAGRVPAELRGTAFGLINLSIGAGMLPASLLAGWLWDTGSHQAPFIAGACFALLSLGLLVVDPHAESA